MTPHDEMETRVEGVRNWLGVPPVKDLFATPAEHLSPAEQQNRMLFTLYRDQQEIRLHGCDIGQVINGRVKKLEAWYYKAVGGMVALGMVSGVIYLTIALVSFFRQGRE